MLTHPGTKEARPCLEMRKYIIHGVAERIDLTNISATVDLRLSHGSTMNALTLRVHTHDAEIVTFTRLALPRATLGFEMSKSQSKYSSR